MQQEYVNLLKTWADALLELQVESKRLEFDGGVLCPCCKVMHGRTADAMYPLVFLYSKTEDKKYYNAAKKLFDWTQFNMRRQNDRLVNDPNAMWYGTTVFYNIQLGELLYNLKDKIEPADYEKWYASYSETTDFIYRVFYDNPDWNVNYRIATATAMAIGYKITGEEKYRDKARRFAEISVAHMDKDGLIYGEGKPTNLPTPKGCYSVDIGYNVEESLPNLVTYLRYIDSDPETEKAVIHSMQAHLNFMLPDGAWDNSWGSRCNKWSYWGSRTSDGCQGAYCYFKDKDPRFYEAAHRSFLLYKKCTVNGLLAGGPHHLLANEPTCVHHTFCHMKSLIPLIELAEENRVCVALPRQTQDGILKFTAADVITAARGNYLATFSCDDYRIPSFDSTASGGTATLVYHKNAGILFSGGPNNYRLAEPLNMQIPNFFENICSLIRIEDGETRSSFDPTARTEIIDRDGKITYTASGLLKNFDLKGTKRYQLRYEITESEFILTAETDSENALFYFPLVAPLDESFVQKGNCAVLHKEKADVHLTCSTEILKSTDMCERFFNPSGGLSSLNLYAKLEKNNPVTLKIKVTDC